MYRLHRKINTISSLASKRSHFFFTESTISAQKGRIIIMIKRAGEMSPSSIAYKLSLTRATVTQQINELEQDGYILKVEDKEDKRKILLLLTEKGENEFIFIDKTITQIEKDISDIYTKEEQKQFDELLSKGISYYEKVTKGANN